MSGVDRLAGAGFGQRVTDLQRGNDFQVALLGMAGHDLRQPLQVCKAPSSGWGPASVTRPTGKDFSEASVRWSDCRSSSMV